LDSLMTTRPCRVEIHTRSFEDNLRFLLELAAPHAELLAVVKADAYGHSLKLCAPAAVRAGVRWLGVSSVEEGVAAHALSDLGVDLDKVAVASQYARSPYPTFGPPFKQTEWPPAPPKRN